MYGLQKTWQLKYNHILIVDLTIHWITIIGYSAKSNMSI